MLSNEKINHLKDHFYGWEYAVQNSLPVKMTYEHVELLWNVLFDLEDLKAENDKLKNLIEDMELAKLYGKDIERAERNKSKGKVIEDVGELF